MTDYKKRLEQALIEIAIITVSILLAFALERWWDKQIDLRQKGELVSSLIQEFEATAIELDSALTAHRDRQLGASELSQMQTSTIGNVSPDLISQYWYWVVTPDETYPPRGALNSAISGNRLSLIHNQALKSRLAGWSDRLENFRQTERLLAEYTLHEFWPDVATDVILPLNKESIGRETDEVILMPATKNHLNLLALGSNVAIDQIETLQKELTEILQLLQEEIANH
ncbi:MAG TPA: hypothetical protein VNQ14_03925 [Woeseiaceae bacterium]|jgi:hypothetical protein|nr:hypothetical protein [Woeseiaceae bacterium]